MSRKTLILTLAVAAATAPTVARAQVIELDTIFVEGTSLEGTPQPVSGPGAPAADTVPAPGVGGGTGSAVTVVTGEQLRQSQIRHAAEALRSLPGVHVSQSGGFGSLTQVRIRGAEANHTLVLIDGVEVNTASEGEFDFSNLLAEDIEQIEVIRGPQSGLYGSNALAGVINIITGDGRRPGRLVARAEGGSFGTRGLALSLSGGSDEAHGRLNVQSRATKGFNISPEGTEQDGSDITSLSAKGGFKPAEWLKLDGVFRYGVKEGERDDQIPSLAAVGMLQPNEDTPSHFQANVALAGGTATATLLDGKWVQKLHADWQETKTRDVPLPPAFPSTAINRSWVRSFNYLSTWHQAAPGFFDSSHSVSGLIEQEAEAFTPVTDDAIERLRERLSFAAEWRGEFMRHLLLTANLRYEDNDSFDNVATYRVAGSLAMPGKTARLHASVGTGVKYPTMFEQFGSLPSLGFVPNPGLMPEESFGWDVGLEKALLDGRLLLDVTYFNADLKNQIDTVFSPVFTAINLTGTSRREGVEVSGRWRLSDSTTLGAAYTHLDAFKPDGLREIRRPEHAGRVDVDHRFASGRGAVHIGVQYNGDMEDDGLINVSGGGFAFFLEERVTLDAYTLVRLAASYEVKPGVEVFGRLENLLDQDYQEVFGFETAGLAAYAGVRVVLGSGQ